MSTPTVELIKGHFFILPKQHDQFYRPFTTNVDGHTVDIAKEYTQNGNMVTPENMSAFAANIISPSMQPVQEVYIPNGLGLQRYAFYIELSIQSIFGEEVEVIKGYTDYAGLTPTGHIDPNMELHINSVTLHKIGRSQNALGQHISCSVNSDNLILAKMPDVEMAVSLRPEDAIAFKQLEPMRSVQATVIDQRSSLNSQAKFGRSSHHLPSNYLSDVITAYQQSVLPSEDAYEGSLDMYHKIYSHLHTGSAEGSYFYQAIANGDHTRCTRVKMKDIEAIWPRPPGFWKVTNSVQHDYSITDHTEYWHGASIETQVAFSLTHMVPAFMSQLRLQRLVFSISNENLLNRIEVGISHWTRAGIPGTTEKNTSFNEYGSTTISSEDLLIINWLKGIIEQNLGIGFLQQKAAVFSVYVDCDLITNAKIMVSLNRGIAVPYNSPMFCDSRYSPMIGLDTNSLNDVSVGMEILAWELMSANSSQHIAFPQHQLPIIGDHNSLNSQEFSALMTPINSDRKTSETYNALNAGVATSPGIPEFLKSMNTWTR